MEKVFRINLQARNQAVKALRKEMQKKTKQQWQLYDKAKIAADRQLRNKVKTERKQRREDWLLGPLAPDRNTGMAKGVYGTVDQSLTRGPVIPDAVRRGPNSNGWDPEGAEGRPGEGKEWEGYGNEGNLVVGDRVCVVGGSEDVKGRIGKIKDIQPELGELTVEGLNMADIELPDWARRGGPDKYLSSEMNFKFHDVRLVWSGHDDKTGAPREYIVKHLRGGAPYLQREYGSNIPRHTRYVAGNDVPVPWPEAELQDRDRGEFDTTRQQVEMLTFMPSILESVLPEGVIDELRPKVDRARTRHDLNWVAKKVIEDARSAWWEQRKLITPRQEFGELNAKRRAAQFEKARLRGLDADTLRMIEEVRSVSVRPKPAA